MNNLPERINRNIVRAQLERGQTWRGYLAGDYINAYHIIDGWALGYFVELQSIAELEEKSAAILQYLEPELGRRIATWTAPAQPEAISRYNGRAWRVGQPLLHDKNTKILDVVNYEINELGNQEGSAIIVNRLALGTTGHWPARRSIWIAPTRSIARQYRGTPESITVRGIIVARDNCNGFLIALDPDQAPSDYFLS